MPVARIISPSFEDALKFADYLRPVFDTVEIAQPGRASATPVDLEVNLELCTPEQAWQQVAELAQQPDADIFIAPGTLVPPSPEEKAEPAAAQSVAPPVESVAAAPQPGAVIVRPKAEPNWLGRTRQSMRQWLFDRAQLRAIRHVEQERLQQERQRQRQMALQFERARREQEAQERELARAAEKQLALQKAERRRLQQEEARRLKQEAVLRRQAQEEQQRQAREALLRHQAEEQALRLQAEEEQRRRYVQEAESVLQRQAQEAQAPQALEPASTLESAIVPVEPQPVETAPVAARAEAELPPVRTARVHRLRPAMAMAAVTSTLLMAALLGYAHRRPASPVPLSVLQRSNMVEQKVPFGPAVVPAVTLGVPVLPAAASPAEMPAAIPVADKGDFQSDFRRVRVGRHEVDYVSDDVTVRHFGSPRRLLRHPATDAPVSASSRGVKRISDME